MNMVYKYVHRFFACALLICSLHLDSVYSQISKPFSNLYPVLPDISEPFFVDCKPIIHAYDKDSLTIICAFRIQYDALTFTTSTSPFGEYESNPTIEIECRDTNGIIKYRTFWKDTVYANSYEQSNAKNDYAYGILDFNVVKGHYIIIVSLFDRGTQSIKKIRVPSITIPSYGFGTPYFTESNPSGDFFQPIIMNGNTSFTKSQQFVCIPVYGDIKKPVYAELKRMQAYQEFSSGTKQVSAALIELIPDISIEVPIADKYHILQDCKIMKVNKKGNTLAIIQFPENALAPGKYSMNIMYPGVKKKQDTAHFEFTCLWEDMPKSLINASYAADIMRYILKDDEYDTMIGGSDIDIRSRLLQWWKKLDPTPTTIYNEAMTEYFRRADIAFTTFQTIQESDGIMTSRGKIALLYGFPQSIEKNILNGNIQQEIWNYSAILNKKFFFEQKNGEKYILKKILSIQ